MTIETGLDEINEAVCILRNYRLPVPHLSRGLSRPHTNEKESKDEGHSGDGMELNEGEEEETQPRQDDKELGYGKEGKSRISDEVDFILRQEWANLGQLIREVERQLVPVKRRFTRIAQQQIEHFREEMMLLANRFAAEGPGTVAGDLESGLQIMKVL
ncbi:unnamed protein product [Protopolystoma xenopodis]|uniref:Uncharacterized protein n=1 Tax=Protopolystoma xenopodis TaxID=117903 RepID=A0A3S5AAA6_9PLAT|nr:unnamed protein product [Protopolystoma xenopodis]